MNLSHIAGAVYNLQTNDGELLVILILNIIRVFFVLIKVVFIKSIDKKWFLDELGLLLLAAKNNYKK